MAQEYMDFISSSVPEGPRLPVKQETTLPLDKTSAGRTRSLFFLNINFIYIIFPILTLRCSTPHSRSFRRPRGLDGNDNYFIRERCGSGVHW